MATEAAQAVLALMFADLGLHRVIARLDSRNERSAALCRRLGMRQEAHQVRSEWFKGEWVDLLVYAILADGVGEQVHVRLSVDPHGSSSALSPNSCQR